MNSLSEESVWAAGRSVTAGDLEMLLQSPTKEKNQDNKALIPPDDSSRLTEQIIQAGERPSRAMLGRAGPGCQSTEGDGSTRKRLWLLGCVHTQQFIFLLLCDDFGEPPDLSCFAIMGP